jgi:hypothetical protein
MLVGGSRSGKTFLLCRAIVTRAWKFKETRHVILRQRGNAVRQSIGLDTMPKVLRTCFPEMKVKEDKSLGRWIVEENGSEIWMGGLDDKERVDKILGTEFATMYFNECSQIPFSSIETALTRLAQQAKGDDFVQRAYYDLNPTGNRHWSYRQFVEHKNPMNLRPLRNPDNYKWLRVNPVDNAANLSESYLDELASGSDRSRKRFFEGEFIAEIEGALWSTETIERGRLDPVSPADTKALGITRIAIGVDPSGTSGAEEDRSNAVGIIVMGKQPGTKGRAFVLEDLTINAHPSVWAKIVASAADKWDADVIVAEKNYGGEMVRHTIKTADPQARIKLVTASRGKHIRAEPIAALYEESDGGKSGGYTGRVHHCGRFDGLEEELCNMSADGYHGQSSPNRLDALVWAGTELFGKSVVSSDALIAFGGGSTFIREPTL